MNNCHKRKFVGDLLRDDADMSVTLQPLTPKSTLFYIYVLWHRPAPNPATGWHPANPAARPTATWSLTRRQQAKSGRDTPQANESKADQLVGFAFFLPGAPQDALNAAS